MSNLSKTFKFFHAFRFSLPFVAFLLFASQIGILFVGELFEESISTPKSFTVPTPGSGVAQKPEIVRDDKTIQSAAPAAKVSIVSFDKK